MQIKKYRDRHIMDIKLLCKCIRDETHNVDRIVNKQHKFMLTDASFNKLRNIRRASEWKPNYNIYRSELRIHKIQLFSKVKISEYSTLKQNKRSWSVDNYLTNRKTINIRRPTGLSLLYQRFLNKHINSKIRKEVSNIIKDSNRFLVRLDQF